MKRPPIPDNEEQRLGALRAYNILDSLPEQAFDDIVFIASQICNTSIALISLVDEDRQWFKAKWGLETSETARDFSFCAHAINTPDEFFQVQDALEDDRFSDNPLVLGDPGFRFYAAIPLKVEDDLAIGTLCVADQEGGTLTEDQIRALRALSRQVMVQMELREESTRQHQKNKQLSQQINTTASELMEAQLKYESLYQGSPVMMASIDAQTGEIQKCNETTAKVLGYALDEILHKHILDLYHPDCHKAVKRAFETFRETGSLENKRLSLRAKSGKKIHVELSVSPVYGTNGEIRYSNSVWRDISSLVKVEQQLREANVQLTRNVEERTEELQFSNQRLKRALDGSQDAIWDWVDLEEDEVWCSPNFYEMLGYSPFEVQPTQTCFINYLLHPDDAPTVTDMLEQAQYDHQPFKFECRLQKKSGVYHWFSFRGKVSPGADQKKLSMSGSASHIDEQKNLQHALSEAKKFLTKVTDLVPSIIYVFNQQTMSNEYANREIGKVMGFSDEEVQNLGSELMPSLCHPDDLPLVFEYFNSLKQMNDNEFMQLEYRMRHKNGQYRWLLSIDTIFERDEDGQVLKHIGVASDITQFKEIEVERTNQHELLALKNKELQQLAYIATHDLKVPILNISGHFDYLKTKLPPDHDDVSESIGYVDKNILQFQNTIDELTNLLRLKSEPVALESINLTEIIKDLVQLYAPRITAMNGRLTLGIDRKMMIVGSRVFCHSIFKNLIGNAIKYHSPDRNLRIAINRVKTADCYEVQVIDNGIGIDLDLHRNKLFGMFKRFHDHVEGTGMGLHMTKHMLESQGGTIGLESKVGEGTTVTITFKHKQA